MSSQSKQRILSVVGKNFDTLTQLDKKIINISVGQNHFIYQNSKLQTFGFGSNKFGQLGIKSNQNFYKNPIKIFQNIQVKNISCGPQHTFIINDKNQIFSCGLNIKGQLGHSMFQNIYEAKLVTSLLPSGNKNPKTLNPSISKSSILPIIELLQKFQLQVKIQQQSLQKKYLLSANQFIISISCGALFTICLSNQGNLYASGYQGIKSFQNHQEQLQKCKFKKIQIQQKIYKITTGLSGSLLVCKEKQKQKQNKFYIWGKFGKYNGNIPKLINKELMEKEIVISDGKLGDQFGIFLNNKGQVYTFGENFDNQLGIDQTNVNFREKLQKVQKCPLMSQIFVGRNTVFALTLDKNQIYCWGSNKYGQLYKNQGFQLTSLPSSNGIILDQHDKIIPSSYCTFFLTKKPLPLPKQSIQKPKKPLTTNSNSNNSQQQQCIPLSEYLKILQQYRQLKSLNLTLLQKIQPAIKKKSCDTQTYSKLQLQGVTSYRKFNSNIDIKWSQLNLQSQINQGGFGLIYKAKWRQITVIVKKFKIQNGDVSVRDFLSECHAMQAVRHPHIVMFLGAVTTQPNYSIVLEYCAKGSLWAYLQNQDNNITWEQRRRFAIQIAQGCLYLHLCTPPILHRDLKSLNIFLDGNLKIKIGDFGWTKTLENYMTNKIGTYQWMAPEVIGNKSYTEKADVFSFSIIMWEIASREPPYKNISGTKVSEDVLMKQLRPNIPKKTPQGWVKLMKKCWDKDPNKRPDFKQIIKELQLMKLTV